jgi:hypothetical protein
MSLQVEYNIRYNLPSISHQIEAATVDAAMAIINEDPATPNHVDRLNWANFVMGTSQAAWLVFAWLVAQNPSVQTSVQADPTGESVSDSDIKFIVNSNLATAIQHHKSSAYYRPPV